MKSANLHGGIMLTHLSNMSEIMSAFPQQLLKFRKALSLTQQALADKIGINVSQLKRYEYGDAQPTLEVIKKMAIALNVTSDNLIFGDTERTPVDELRLQFEALKEFTPQEMEVAKKVIQGLILQHHANQFQTMGNYESTERPST